MRHVNVESQRDIHQPLETISPRVRTSKSGPFRDIHTTGRERERERERGGGEEEEEEIKYYALIIKNKVKTTKI